VEIGAGQAPGAGAILAAGGLVPQGSRTDLAGTVRCLILQLPAP
jgi:hypothetical protein